MTTTAVCRSGGGCDDLDHGSATGVLRQCRLILFIISFFFFFKLEIYFMRFPASKQLHINDHLNAHLGYKSCPRSFRHRRPSVWRDSNPRSRGWESNTLTTRPSAPSKEVISWRGGKDTNRDVEWVDEFWVYVAIRQYLGANLQQISKVYLCFIL